MGKVAPGCQIYIIDFKGLKSNLGRRWVNVNIGGATPGVLYITPGVGDLTLDYTVITSNYNAFTEFLTSAQGQSIPCKLIWSNMIRNGQPWS